MRITITTTTTMIERVIIDTTIPIVIPMVPLVFLNEDSVGTGSTVEDGFRDPDPIHSSGFGTTLPELSNFVQAEINVKIKLYFQIGIHKTLTNIYI